MLAGFKDAALPAFVASGAEARASALSHVDSIFSAASPSTPVPVGFLVDRAGIQAISAKFTQVQPNKNGRWKLNGATLRMIEMSDSDSHCKIKPQWGRFK